MKAEDYQEGQILLIDKPLKWSSFQAVNKLKFGLIKELKLQKKFKNQNRALSPKPNPAS